MSIVMESRRRRMYDGPFPFLAHEGAAAVAVPGPRKSHIPPLDRAGVRKNRNDTGDKKKLEPKHYNHLVDYAEFVVASDETVGAPT